MTNLNHFYKIEKKSPKIDYFFYLASILLAATVLSYLIFNFKVQLQNKLIQDIEKKSLSLGAGEGQVYNKKVLDYKKKIDDFAIIINNHKITSNIFSFIEENTMSDIWFSSFNMQGTTNEMKLSGEAKDMETLSRQVEIFEKKQDHIKKIGILDSQINSSGKVVFIIDITLDPKIFNYQESISEYENNT